MPDAFVVASELRGSTERTYKALNKAVRKTAQLGLARVRARASGRPGPRRITGDYKRSMSIVYLDALVASIGTNAPQAARLEYGFVGEDALGRNYAQPPFPHWRPMADELPEILAANVDAALREGGLVA